MAGGFNGSGVFSLAQPAFVPNTPISSSAMNSNLSGIATDGLSEVICKDGQTVITGALKGFTGSVGLPSYSYSADTDSGMYRIAANNVGIAAGGTKILDIATTGLSVTGTLSVSGSFSPSGQFLGADGTVALPEYSFTSDPDSGVYRIGANNLGVAVNAAKVLDISTTGLNVIGTVSSNGIAFAPLAQGAGMANGTIVESHTGNAVTFAIKTLTGGDPSATDIVYFVFRNVTPGTGNYTVVQVTAALSLTVTSGSTLGTSSGNIPFKLWIEAFNDAGTVRLAVINCLLGTSIYPLGQMPIASSTAEGGAGGADSAQVFYTGTAVAAKAYAILGYASYETGVTTAGAWASAPTRIQLMGAGVPLPGTPLVPAENYSGAVNTGATATPLDDTIPTITEGTQFMSQAYTATSAANILRHDHVGVYATTTASDFVVALHNGGAAIAGVLDQIAAANDPTTVALSFSMLAGVTTTQTFTIRVGDTAGHTFTFNGEGGARKLGGIISSFLRVTEIVA